MIEHSTVDKHQLWRISQLPVNKLEDKCIIIIKINHNFIFRTMTPEYYHFSNTLQEQCNLYRHIQTNPKVEALQQHHCCEIPSMACWSHWSCYNFKWSKNQKVVLARQIPWECKPCNNSWGSSQGAVFDSRGILKKRYRLSLSLYSPTGSCEKQASQNLGLAYTAPPYIKVLLHCNLISEK